MVALETGARSLSLCLAGLFALGIAHKMRALGSGNEEAQPVIARYGLHGGWATAALAAAAGAEAGITTVLLIQPAFGCLSAGALLLAYSLLLGRLAPDESCMCLGELFDARSRAGAIRRNVGLGVAAAMLGVADLAGLIGFAALSQAVVGIALILGAAAAATAAVQHRTVPHSQLAA